MKNGRRLAMKIFNAGKFVLQNSADAGSITEPLDLAFLAKLKAVCEDATKSFENFEPAQALMETEKFFWSHYTDSYLELVKTRTWGEKTSDHEKKVKASAVHALRLGLKTFLKLFAPVLPYTTEEVWGWAFTGESKTVHHAKFGDLADFEGLTLGNPSVFDAAMAAQAAINQQKTLAKVSIARPIVMLKMKAHPETAEHFKQAQSDVCGATKTEKLELIADAALEKNQFVIDACEFGPDAKTGQM
jgi:valyl-tRNA synthetase